MTETEARACIRGNSLHAWYSTEHMLTSGDVVYEGLNGKPVAVTFVCWSKEKGDKWVNNSKFKDYVYLGTITPNFLGDLGATELI